MYKLGELVVGFFLLCASTSLTNGVLAATPLTVGSCKSDQDCLSFTLRLHQLPTETNQVTDSGYSCLNGTCSFIVSSESVCRKASDCSQYAFLANAISSNRSDLLPAGYTTETVQSYMESLCAPQYCTIKSSCDSNYYPFYGNGLSSTESCCAGIALNDPCLRTGSPVTTCAGKTSCSPSADFNSAAMICATAAPPQSTQWIGIILTLIAAALTNLGLNLQKLALRKRHEKEVKKIEKEKIGLFYRLTNLKLSVSSFYRSVSISSLPKFPYLKPGQTTGADQDQNLTDVNHPANTEATDSQSVTSGPDNEIQDVGDEKVEAAIAERRGSGHLTPSSARTMSPSAHPIGQLKCVNPSDKDEFQSKLGMANLMKNPRWWLGFIVFVIGNFTNFAALNFAAQSLIGPLGSFSLVCNVIIAPMMNGEKWTWKDILGVFLIVCGSAVVVIFSSSTHDDYNACVLLKLFQNPPTVVFLIFTCSIIFATFVYIIVVEKNLDFKEASVVVIEETIESGELVNVEANPHRANQAASISPAVVVSPAKVATTSSTPVESGEIRRRPAASNANRVKRLSMIISDEVGEDGSNLRVVTINSEEDLGGRSARRIPDENQVDEDSDSDDITQDVGLGPSTRLPTHRKRSLTNIGAVPLMDADGNNIQALFGRKAADGGASIHSVALTFKLPSASQSGPPALDLESNVSNEKIDYQRSNGGTVVVLPNAKKEHQRSLWMTRLIEYGRQYPWIEKLYQLKLIPRFQKKIPLESRLVRYGLPFAYASLGGLMATLLTLFAKATIYLLTGSFQGDNQFTSFPAYFFTFITVFCAVSQIYWINLGLARYDALLQIPVFYVVWTLFDVIGGGVYYREFDGFTAAKYGLFSLGVGIIFIGVGILATRLAAIADDDKEIGM